MPTPEFSYPLNPPNPSPPSSNPSPPSPPSSAPPASPPGDPCTLLNKLNDNVELQCDNLHFGTEKCQIDWAYFNTAPCGFGAKPYQNGIGFAGSYFNAFDEKGFLRIEGQADSDAGEPNLYSYVGVGLAFEAYMYKDGLNLKGLLGGLLGNRESCHIKIFKSAQQTEIDFQGATNLSSEGAEIFKSQLYKQTIEGFVKKYDYNQEWVGLEANVSKSFVWGGLDQSNFYRLMYDNTGPKGFLEILKNGYDTYAQLQVKSDKVNLYSQLNGSNTYFGIEAVSSKVEEVLYYNNSIVKLLANDTEASTYNTYSTNMYATLVSKNNEGYVYLQGNGNGYSFLESKLGDGRLFGSADGGDDYFDISTKNYSYIQVNDSEDRFYLAPVDIPQKSDNHHYAAFHTLTYGIDKKKVAFVSSADVDLSETLNTACWADYPCFYNPLTATTPCFAPLTLGGTPNNDCKLSSFGVEVEGGQGFELYQYAYGIDLKTRGAVSPAVKIYTNQNTLMQLDCIGDVQAGVNATRYDGSIQSYNLVDNSYGYQNIEVNNGANIRSVAGFDSADTTIYTNGGPKQVAIGADNKQAYMQFYSNNGSNQMFGHADGTEVQWQGTVFGAYAQMKVNSAEGKFQTSKGGAYAYMFSDLNSSELSLVTSSRATINASAGSANWSVTLANGEANAYWQGGNGQVSINTDDCEGQYVSLREIDVCIDGEKKKMIILASEPY
jgi:hypothetical protein